MVTIFDPVLDVVIKLRDCVCAALLAADRPVCRCSLEPGVRATADYCASQCVSADGTATIVITRVQPVQSQGASPCSSIRRLITMAVTVWRCVPTVCESGALPSADELNVAEAGILQDRMIVEQAIRCCFDADCQATYFGWVAESSSGGCGGGTTTIQVEVADCPCGSAVG